jgi:hypothetical protein
MNHKIARMRMMNRIAAFRYFRKIPERFFMAHRMFVSAGELMRNALYKYAKEKRGD